MTLATPDLLRPEVVGLPVYDPGADPDGVPRVLKMSNNENPYGPSPAVTEALQRYLNGGVARYPDPMGKRLTSAIAARLDVSPAQVVLGNGSENILEMLCRAVLSPGDVVTVQRPGFSLHEIFPRVAGARVVPVLSPDFAFDGHAWRRALATEPKLVFVANPGNPTGALLNGQQLAEVIDSVPRHALLVLDEAYVEYAQAHPEHADGLAVLRDQLRPWIVLRTFSKAYGLAGLRVGYGVASDTTLIDALHRVRTPYNVNQPAQEAALAALGDEAHVADSVRRTGLERDRVTAALRATGLRVAPSAANFLFIDTGRPALDVADELLRSGIIVKPWREPGFEHFIRASMSLPADNDRFVESLVDVT